MFFYSFKFNIVGIIFLTFMAFSANAANNSSKKAARIQYHLIEIDTSCGGVYYVESSDYHTMGELVDAALIIDAYDCE